MTKREASEKVAKLMRLAQGSTNPHEAKTAKKQAEKLVADHHLSDSDLKSGEMAAAFDDLVDRMQKFVASHPALPVASGLFGNTSAIVTDIIHRIKNLGDTDKATRLRQIVTVVRTTSFIAGDNPTVKEIKAIVDDTIRNHDLSI